MYYQSDAEWIIKEQLSDSSQGTPNSGSGCDYNMSKLS